MLELEAAGGCRGWTQGGGCKGGKSEAASTVGEVPEAMCGCPALARWAPGAPPPAPPRRLDHGSVAEGARLTPGGVETRRPGFPPPFVFLSMSPRPTATHTLHVHACEFPTWMARLFEGF